jgi:hypothetical protein
VWYFLTVMAVIAVGLIWNHRRNAVRREAASKERLEQMMKAGASPVLPAAAPAPAATPVTGQGAPEADAAPEEATPIAYAARAHVLSQAEKLVYYLLRTGLPDLEVFPKVPLVAIIDVPGKGYDHEQQLRRLSRQVIDFVVCDKEMKVVAAVQLAAIGPEAVVAQRIRSECLKSAGIRLVRVEPKALPRRAEVRAFICGAGAEARRPV